MNICKVRNLTIQEMFEKKPEDPKDDFQKRNNKKKKGEEKNPTENS